MGPAWPALLFLTAFVWAVSGLMYQAARAMCARRISFARPQGNSFAGVLYMFTTAMRPSRKESVSRHPASFVLGLVLHGAAFGGLAGLAVALLAPSWLGRLRIPLFALALAGLIAAGATVVRRVANPTVRTLSTPDDFVAIGLAIVFLTTLAAACFRPTLVWTAAVAASLLLFYVPVGKLRHMVFFFLARADLGSRLGFRGALPSHRAGDPRRERA